MRNHDRFVDQMVALGGCIHYFLESCKAECGDGRMCRKAIEIVAKWTDKFRDMPRWRGYLLDLAVRFLVK